MRKVPEVGLWPLLALSPRVAMLSQVKLMTDLGVKIVHGKALGRDFTVDSLQADGAKAVLVATGLPEPQRHAAFEGLSPEQATPDDTLTPRRPGTA